MNSLLKKSIQRWERKDMSSISVYQCALAKIYKIWNMNKNESANPTKAYPNKSCIHEYLDWNDTYDSHAQKVDIFSII